VDNLGLELAALLLISPTLYDQFLTVLNLSDLAIIVKQPC